MKHLRAASSIARNSAASCAPASLVRPLSPLIQQHLGNRPLAVARHTQWIRPPLSRPFSYTASYQKKKSHAEKRKKGSKGNEEPEEEDADAALAADGADPSEGSEPVIEIDPFDFTDLNDAFNRADTRFLEDLKKLRTGGRFTGDIIGAIPVQPDKKSAQTFPLRDVATVAPLGGGAGRRWSILAFEEASVKPIISAVLRSPEFNQQPQRSEDNPLELTMTVEPERADALAKRAKDICQDWRVRIRDEAHKRADLHKRWRSERVVLSDTLHKLRDRLQKLQDDRMKVILNKEKEAVAAIMSKRS
ncbi:ribosome recycling factor-domain-containing protein [Chaetomium sp. MPI-SDFR-AT-0129]|nr:ribosome recycling factor-domain-containing protein [Chaetomium sp. MPI-SDFR-AT-0129]